LTISSIHKSPWGRGEKQFLNCEKSPRTLCINLINYKNGLATLFAAFFRRKALKTTRAEPIASLFIFVDALFFLQRASRGARDSLHAKFPSGRVNGPARIGVFGAACVQS